jgi:hypothetical protein
MWLTFYSLLKYVYIDFFIKAVGHVNNGWRTSSGTYTTV